MNNSNMAANDYPAYLIPYIDFDRLNNQNKQDVRKQHIQQKPQTNPKPVRTSTQPARNTQRPIVQKRKNNYAKTVKKIFIFLFVILAFFGVFKTIYKNPSQGKVTNFFWERTLVIEKMVHSKKVGSFLPEGAKILSSRDEMIGYGTDKKGNLKKIYNKIYTYEVDEWVFSRDLKTYGNGKSPNWSTSTLQPNEQIVSRDEVFYVYVLDYKKNIRNYIVPRDLWDELKKGQKVDLSIFDDKKETDLFKQTETGKVLH